MGLFLEMMAPCSLDALVPVKSKDSFLQNKKKMGVLLNLEPGKQLPGPWWLSRRTLLNQSKRSLPPRWGRDMYYHTCFFRGGTQKIEAKPRLPRPIKQEARESPGNEEVNTTMEIVDMFLLPSSLNWKWNNPMWPRCPAYLNNKLRNLSIRQI